MLQRASEAIERPHDDDIDFPPSRLPQQPIELLRAANRGEFVERSKLTLGE
jgi:hypothetical protein